MKNELHKAFSSLKKEYKEIIYAIDIEGLTYKEVSLKTKIPIGTLLSQRHRALGILSKHLEKYKNN